MPEYDDRALYEKLVLDGFQAGLSWITILRKRENFRKAFHGFDPEKIARYGKRDFERLLKNEGIIRSSAKIEARDQGRAALARHRGERAGRLSRIDLEACRRQAGVNRFKTMKQVPAKTEMSEGLAKELKQRGFNFCGPVIVYAFAQAVGMVNDHIVTCHRHDSWLA